MTPAAPALLLAVSVLAVARACVAGSAHRRVQRRSGRSAPEGVARRLAARVVHRAAITRRRQRVSAALPAALEATAASVRSGASLTTAVADASASNAGRAAGFDRIATGSVEATFAERVAAWSVDLQLPAARLAAAALCLADELGGSQAHALDGVATTLRQRQALQAEARSLATQARMSAAVIAASPVAFGALAAAADPTAAGFLFGTPVGWLCIAGGIALDGVGAWWMARLVRRVTQ